MKPFAIFIFLATILAFDQCQCHHFRRPTDEMRHEQEENRFKIQSRFDRILFQNEQIRTSPNQPIRVDSLKSEIYVAQGQLYPLWLDAATTISKNYLGHNSKHLILLEFYNNFTHFAKAVNQTYNIALAELDNYNPNHSIKPYDPTILEKSIPKTVANSLVSQSEDVQVEELDEYYRNHPKDRVKWDELRFLIYKLQSRLTKGARSIIEIVANEQNRAGILEEYLSLTERSKAYLAAAVLTARESAYQSYLFSINGW